MVFFDSNLDSSGSFEDMRNDCGTTTADILGHTYTRILDLGGSSFTTQLLNSFHDLIHPGSPNRVSAGF